MREASLKEFPYEDLQFVRSVIARTGPLGKQHKIISQQLSQVEERADNETLHLAVLGEFNSGKSTFINALLRMPLLKSANQASTAAATMIRFDTEFSLKVDFTDGVILSGTSGNCSQLRDKISSLTSLLPENADIHQLLDLLTVAPEVSSYVRQVDIAFPAESLRSHLCIIDTPGIGAGMEYAHTHQSIAERVAADIADAAVVLIPANNPMTKTLMNFLTERASHFLHRCIFVITKMDHIEQSDRPAIREFVAGKLAQILKPKPMILETAAATVLPVKRVPAHLQDAWAYWKGNFAAMEEQIHQSLARNRKAIIAEHLTVLLQSLLTELQSAVSKRRIVLEREHRLLQNNSIVDLQHVLKSLSEKCHREIEEEAKDCKNKTERDATALESRAIQAVSQLIEQASSASLPEVLEVNVPKSINYEQGKFDEASESHLSDLRKRCEKAQQLFAEQFESHYQNLRALGARIEVPRMKPISLSLSVGHFSSAKAALQAVERWKTKTGEVVGGIAGFVAGPFVATIAGLIVAFIMGKAIDSFLAGVIVFLIVGAIVFVATVFVGGKTGAGIGSSLVDVEKQRREVLSVLIPELVRHIETVKSSRIADFDAARKTALSTFDEIIRAHRMEYTETVEGMLQDHQKRVLLLTQEEKQVELDSATLRQRTDQLETERQRLFTAHGAVN